MKTLKLAIVAIIAAFAAASATYAEDITHKLAIHVDQNDPAVMNLALNNAKNVREYYAAKGEKVQIEIVAYGPGLNMYVAGSPVEGRIEGGISGLAGRGIQGPAAAQPCTTWRRFTGPGRQCHDQQYGHPPAHAPECSAPARLPQRAGWSAAPAALLA